MDQDKWIELLENLNEKKKPILASNWFNIDGEWRWGKWFPLSQAARPIDHRSVLSNEIVIDLDAKKWDTNKEFAKIIKSWLDEKKIPYLMADSGGKGLHFHIFFEMDVPDDFIPTVHRAKKQGFNLRQLRLAIWKYILMSAGVKMNYLGNGDIFDDHSVNFDDDGSKGALIREFGGRKYRGLDAIGNADWGWKTLITEVPERKVKIDTPSNVIYPSKIETWMIPIGIIKGFVTEYLQKNEVKVDERKITKYEGLYSRLPCIQMMIQKGVEEGRRHDAAGLVALICALDKLNDAKTLEILQTYKKACDDLGGVTSFSIKELKGWVDWYRKRGDEIFWDNRTCNIVVGFKAGFEANCNECPLRKNLNKDSIEFLVKGNVIQKIQDQFELEIVNERENRLLLFFCYCSAYLDHRIHPKLSGQSSIGKSFILNKILNFIPNEDVLEKLTSASSKYFNYALTQNPDIPKVEKDGKQVPNIDGKILVIQEFEGAQEAINTLRPLMSGDQDGLNVGIIDKDADTDSNAHKNMICVGTPVFACASTSYTLDKEFMTRVWEMELDDSPEQTRNVMDFEGEEDVNPGCHKSEFRDTIKDSVRLLKQSVVKVLNPFSMLLSKKMPVTREFVRLRRDFKKIKEFIKIVAWINQFQRPKMNIGGEDYVLVTLEDYDIIRKLIQPSFRMIFAGSQQAREVYALCEKYASMGDSINTQQVTKDLGWGSEKVRRMLNLLDSKGFLLRKKDESNGRNYIYEVRHKQDIEFPILTMADLKAHYEELKIKKPSVADILVKILDDEKLDEPKTEPKNEEDERVIGDSIMKNIEAGKEKEEEVLQLDIKVDPKKSKEVLDKMKMNGLIYEPRVRIYKKITS